MMRRLAKPAAVLAAFALAVGLTACGEKKVTAYEPGKYSGAPVAAPWDSPQFGGKQGAVGGGPAGTHAGPERLLTHPREVGSRHMTILSWRTGLAAAVLAFAGFAARSPRPRSSRKPHASRCSRTLPSLTTMRRSGARCALASRDSPKSAPRRSRAC